MEIGLRRWVVWFLILAAPALAGERRAKNVILFIGDAAGIPTINAASIYEYSQPRKLFLQNMPHIGLMETSTASEWVTDSAAGMTAIVTGYKTHDGVISQSDAAVRRKKDGAALKTILEYAEEHGLSTGVVSNSSVASATPAACYAHANDRKKTGEIFAQALKSRFGDGIDVMIGPNREEIVEATRKLGMDIMAELQTKGPKPYDSLDAIPADARRAVVLFDDADFDLNRATQRAIDVLSRNSKGFFLMVESDCHTEKLIQGLERTIALDTAIRRTAERMKADETLIVFTADHSYDLRIHDGERGQPLLGDLNSPNFGDDQESIRLENVRRDDDHTAEEVLVSAQGPGAERVRGIFSNTDVFHIMMAACGWDAVPSNGR
jgi:alkaline phosphatase